MLFRVLTAGSLLLLTVVTARYLGPEGRGLFALVVLTSGLVVALLGGVMGSAAYRVSNRREDPSQVALQATLLALGMGGLGLLVAVTTFFVVDGQDSIWVIFLGVALPPLLIVAVLRGVFLGTNDILAVNLSDWLPVMLALTLMLAAFAALATSVEVALGAWAAAQFLTVGWLLWRGRSWWRAIDWRRVSIIGLWAMLTFGLQIGVANIVSLLDYRISLIFLERMRSLADVGIYSVSISLAQGLWLISSSVSTAVYAPVGMASHDEAIHLTARGMRHSLFIISACAAVLALLADPLLHILVGERYAGAVTPLRILLPGMAFYAPAAVYATFFTNRLGKPQLSLAIATISLVVNLALTPPLIATMGINGAALATTAAFTFASLAGMVLFHRYTQTPWTRMLILNADDLADYKRLVSRLTMGYYPWRRGVS